MIAPYQPEYETVQIAFKAQPPKLRRLEAGEARLWLSTGLDVTFQPAPGAPPVVIPNRWHRLWWWLLLGIRWEQGPVP
jgi:hypothetical protein